MVGTLWRVVALARHTAATSNRAESRENEIHFMVQSVEREAVYTGSGPGSSFREGAREKRERTEHPPTMDLGSSSSSRVEFVVLTIKRKYITKNGK